MKHTLFITLCTSLLIACGGGQPPQSPSDESAQDVPVDSATSTSASTPLGSDAIDNGDETGATAAARPAASAHGVGPSKIKPTKTMAAMKFFVLDMDKGPVEGIVISLTGPDGKTFYTKETDAKGYAEVLVSVGQNYELVYLSLGRRDVTATLPVPNEPKLSFKFTLHYRGYAPTRSPGQTIDPGFILEGVEFDTGKSKIRPSSLPQLDSVLEYMTHKKSTRIQISGHSDNVGDSNANKLLSERRAQACKEYLISKGIEASRIEAVGYGAEQPMASNDTPSGRQENRRIEAKELP